MNESIYNNFSTFSKPAQLKITDLKICKINLPPWGCTIIKIETNQGLVGFGELRDGASATFVKILKSRILGENPCEVEKIFRKIKQFGGPARQAAGVAAIELALWDLVGKAYGIPVYQLIGGRFRQDVRLYGDIHIEEGRFTGILSDPKIIGERLLEYMDQGFNVLKILSVELIVSKEGNCCGPLDWITKVQKLESEARRAAREGNFLKAQKLNSQLYEFNAIPHPQTNLRITEKGLDELEEYIKVIRDTIGYTIPLAIDHFGHFPLPDMIKIARRLEKFNLAWLEDMLPWYLTNQYKDLKRSTTSPLATGEDIYLSENFIPLLESGSLDLVHPDLLTVGGVLEAKKLGDVAGKYGASMAIHMCESPIASIAGAHAATASENFFALEYDAFDSPWWNLLINGPGRPIVKNGFMSVSDAPGFGIESLNEDLIREHGPIKSKDIWLSTDEWDGETSLDRIWS